MRVPFSKISDFYLLWAWFVWIMRLPFLIIFTPVVLLFILVISLISNEHETGMDFILDYLKEFRWPK